MAFCVRAALCLAFGLGLVSADVSAQSRVFPATARDGNCTFLSYPNIVMNGTALSLSAAVKIRGTDNLIVTPATLSGVRAPVKYTLDAFGAIDRIWLLSASEARAIPSPPRPVN